MSHRDFLRGRVRTYREPCSRSASPPTVPREQIQEFATRFRPMRTEVRVRRLAIGDPIFGDTVLRHVPFHLVRADAVRLHRVQSENLGPQRGSDLGVAVFFTKLV